MTIPESHPYWHVRSVIQGDPRIVQGRLSFYKYRPQSIVDERQVISISRSQLLDEHEITKILGQCPADRDVAIHSEFDLEDGMMRHLPMVDMSTSARAHLDKLMEFIDAALPEGFTWFQSGRSFHGYGRHLIDESDWPAFMGRLLLSNQKDLKPTVDPRWVGHRLIAGYAALRWTKNTEHYLATPQKAGDLGPRSSVNKVFFSKGLKR